MHFSNNVSILVERQLPSHIRENYPKFITFLEKYYEYLETSRGVETHINEVKFLRDIDSKTPNHVFEIDITFPDEFSKTFFNENLSDFNQEIIQTNSAKVIVFKGKVISVAASRVNEELTTVVLYATQGKPISTVGNRINDTRIYVTEVREMFESSFEYENEHLLKIKEEFSPSLPNTFYPTTNKKTFIKNLKKFLKAKGTEESYKTFFKAFFNSAIQFYYPKIDILRISDGKWDQFNFIKLKVKSSLLGTQLALYAGKNIVQFNSQNKIIASGIVRDVFQSSVDGQITESSVNYNFLILTLTDINGAFLKDYPISIFENAEYISTEDYPIKVGSIIQIQDAGLSFQGNSLYDIGENIEIASTNINADTNSPTKTNIKVRIDSLLNGVPNTVSIIESGRFDDANLFTAYIPSNTLTDRGYDGGRVVNPYIYNSGTFYGLNLDQPQFNLTYNEDKALNNPDLYFQVSQNTIGGIPSVGRLETVYSKNTISNVLLEYGGVFRNANNQKIPASLTVSGVDNIWYELEFVRDSEEIVLFNKGLKTSVVAATTQNITLTGTQTIDGVSVSISQRVLVKNQTNNTQNGIYVVASGAWTRATDFDSTDDLINGAVVKVTGGTLYTNKKFCLTSSKNSVIGTDPIQFVQFDAQGIATVNSVSSVSTGIINTITLSEYGVYLKQPQILIKYRENNPSNSLILNDGDYLYFNNDTPLGDVKYVKITNEGSGYSKTSLPTVTFASAPSGGVTAEGQAIVDDNGYVVGIKITNAGYGYTTNPSVTIAAPVSGTQATASAYVLSFNNSKSGGVSGFDYGAQNALFTINLVSFSGDFLKMPEITVSQKSKTVKAATTVATGNITLSGTQTIDGVSLVATDLVLVKNQTTTSENGIYEVSSSSWVRASDYDSYSDLGIIINVQSGTVNSGKKYYQNFTTSFQFGSSSVTFVELTTTQTNAIVRSDLNLCKIKFVPNILGNIPGKYQNFDGFLSSPKKIQDGYYYQDFSYDITTEVNPDFFQNTVKELLHPAGFILFSKIALFLLMPRTSISMQTLNKVLDYSISAEGNEKKFDLPYDFENIKKELDFTTKTIITQETNLNWLERLAFKIPPHETFTPYNLIDSGSPVGVDSFVPYQDTYRYTDLDNINTNYKSTYSTGNTPISLFEDIKLKDILVSKPVKTKFVQESFITFS